MHMSAILMACDLDACNCDYRNETLFTKVNFFTVKEYILE